MFLISSVSRSEGSSDSCAKLVVPALRNDPLVPQANASVQAVAPTKEAVAVIRSKAQDNSSKKGAADLCSVDKVLLMKQSDLADSQIRVACKLS